MNPEFKKGFEKTAKFGFQHEIKLNKDTMDFIAKNMDQAADKLKPKIGPGTIFGGALIAGLGLAAGDYLASLFKSPADRTVQAVNRISPVQFGSEGDSNENLYS